ncbi:hypothetical protein KUTeg_001210 [Tegillarca granosa]|uniref:Uncharacterized protein n=1 Tax=Tegillarca granosa TaxID=220873 RepID=A0ABQ9FZX2_TEGGR|nr:hypothetical protein KUTeg_001210 [Tegillarca granosa]
MIIITLFLLFQEYKIVLGSSTNWSVEMDFDNNTPDFFIHKSGQPYTQPDGCLNCNVTYNSLTTTFTLHLYNVTKNNNSGTYGFELQNTTDNNFKIIHQIRIYVRAYPAPKFKWTFLAENENKDEDITSSFLVVNKVDGAFRFRSLLLLNRTYTGKTGHYRIDIWNFLGHASRQIYIQDNKAEERRSDLSDSGIRNVYVNRVREIELAALRPYEDLSINVEKTAYDDINERRGLTNPRDLARFYILNEKSNFCLIVDILDVLKIQLNLDRLFALAVLNFYRQFIDILSVICIIRQDPNEPDSTGSYVSGVDKDADGYLIMKGQNIPNFCKRCDKKSTGSIENKQCLEDHCYKQMEAPSARKSKEKASDENKNTNSEISVKKSTGTPSARRNKENDSDEI